MHTTIDLYPLEDSKSGGLQFVSCAANSPIVAFFIYRTGGRGDIRIFNLDTGAQVPGFDDLPMQDSVLGVAVSPLGSSMAIFRDANDAQFNPGGYYDHVVTIVDLKAKRVAGTMKLVSDTDRSTNPIWYAGESTVAVELLSRAKDFSMQNDWFRGSIHFFDVGSGSQVQVIADPDVDDFSLWGMSADGRTMLTYTGMSHNKGYEQQVVTDARFTLWNRETGKQIAQSPSLKVVHHTCQWLVIGIGSCTPFDEVPELKMSQNGNAVVASWTFGGEPIKVYGLPTQPQSP
jgi:hypothetical protein